MNCGEYGKESVCQVKVVLAFPLGFCFVTSSQSARLRGLEVLLKYFLKLISKQTLEANNQTKISSNQFFGRFETPSFDAARELGPDTVIRLLSLHNTHKSATYAD